MRRDTSLSAQSPKLKVVIDCLEFTSHVDGADLVAKALDGFTHPARVFTTRRLNTTVSNLVLLKYFRIAQLVHFFCVKDVGGGDGAIEAFARKNTLYCRRDSKT